MERQEACLGNLEKIKKKQAWDMGPIILFFDKHEGKREN